MNGEPFDATDRLPEGVTVLEASAGTGKTHTVASIVVTEVACGRPLDELLVVTFTRKATGTLRERVWKRLGAARAALADPSADTTDPVLAHLATGTADEVRERRARIDAALADFDAATIATTHGFCQQVLAGLGVAGDAERDVEVVDDVRQLVDEAVDDLFVRRFHGGGPVLFDRATARRIADAVVENPDARIAPVDDDEASRLRRRFAQTLRTRIVEQKREQRLLTYDDLLTRLATSIEDPERGEIVAARLRRRYSMAIVDEFQDTDTVQWRVLRSAFGAPPCRLVLVGDPKQAVYAFRGGDVYAYLHATEGATRRTLDISWRADQPLLDAVDAFFGGAQLGAEAIAHRPLRARPGAEQPRLLGATVGAPFTVRIVDRSRDAVALTPGRYVQKASARAFIAADLAAEAARLLTSGATIVERDHHGTAGPPRPVRPGDLAVLVRTHREGEQVRLALHAAGVPAVGHGGASVFAARAATDWRELLLALEQPAYRARVRAALLGPFFGWDARRLATASDADWDHVDECLHDWGTVVRRRGLAGLLRQVEASSDLLPRLLGEAGGTRLVSDIRHVAELLDAWQGTTASSLAAAIGWLGEQIAEASHDDDSSRRRLESDADAVAVHTIHGAKGLEFPIVFVPSMWEGPWTAEDSVPVFHDEEGERAVGVGGGTGAVARWQQGRAALERDAEELRLLYVALTRARHRVVVWWATANDARQSPFARVLLGKDDDGRVAPQLDRVPDEAAVRAALDARATTSGGNLAVEEARGGADHPFGAVAATRPLDVARFGRELDRRWVRTSYTGLTAAAHDHASIALERDADAAGTVVAVGDEREVVEVDEAVKVDEVVPPIVAPVGVSEDAGDAARSGSGAAMRPLPLADLPGGARVGTMVHEVLEQTDFAAADLPGALTDAAMRVGAPRLVDGHVGALVAGLASALRTPLGPILDGRALCDLDRADRLDELSFDLPLAGGDTPTGIVTMAAIAEAFATLDASDPLATYHERLADPLLATAVRGFLTGSIDLVARVGGRHVVIDYKTNRLAPAAEPLTRAHYGTEPLVRAMQDAHYPLQAALYSVALHRYLRWRLPGYDPAVHLGGIAYLFLRGMDGATEPSDAADGRASAAVTPDGVFAWQPPPAFVLHLSDVLDRGDR